VSLRLRLAGRVLAARTFKVGDSGSRKVTLYLRRAALRQLFRERALRVTAVASVPYGTGHKTVTKTKLRLLAPRRR
jgi:hypothetical protein